MKVYPDRGPRAETENGWREKGKKDERGLKKEKMKPKLENFPGDSEIPGCLGSRTA